MGLFQFTHGVFIAGAAFAALNMAAFWGGVGAWRMFHPVSVSAAPMLIRKTHQMAAGSNSTCAIVGGKPVCWGESASLTEVPEDLVSAVGVVVGERFGCVLDAEARLRCWGDAPLKAPLSTRVLAMDARSASLCIVNERQRVECWGDVPSPALATAIYDVAVGEGQACALDVMGQVWCWSGRDAPALAEGRFVRLFSGRSQVCGSLGSGLVRCLRGGANAVLPELQGVLEVAVGLKHACVASGEWQVSCWGDSALAQTSIPEGLGRVDGLVAGDNHTCAQLPRNQVRCWGDDSRGQLRVPEVLAVRSE